MKTYPILCTRLLVLAIFCCTQCQPPPPAADPLVYLSADRVDVARKANQGCAFRYVIANSFAKLDNTLQENAIKAGFEVWQKANANIAFLKFTNLPNTELVLRFVDAAALQSAEAAVPVGLVRGKINSISALRKENSTTSAILLSNSYPWDTQTLTRAVAYHAGLYLGMNTSNDPKSLMHPILLEKTNRLIKNDSTLINQLYPQSCRELNAGSLPLSFPLLNPVTKILRIEKQGLIKITASGTMEVGLFVGSSDPDGRTSGFLGGPLADYNIVRDFNHACVMYRLNKATNWTYCGKNCEFSTIGLEYIDLELQVNDNNLSDNVGAYNIIVDYK